jgi:hypothetical protein
VRWDYGPDAIARQPSYYLDPEKRQIVAVKEVTWPPAFSRIAPRVGVAWQASRDGRTVVRFGAGLFYDTTPGTVTDAVNSGPFNVQQYGSGRFAPFSGLLSYGYVSRFEPPEVIQWNVTAERAFSSADVVSLGYVGSLGRDLVRREMGGPGSTTTIRLAIATNRGLSDYQGLQAQYRRRFSRNLQALVSYSWSHSIDNSSTDSLIHWAGAGFDPIRDRGSSDFDVRHSVGASVTYEFQGRWLRGFALDSMLRARSGFPVDILEAEQPMGLNFANVFRPDLVAGQAVWIRDPLSPGGKRLNESAFRQTPGLQQGSLGRNVVPGFGMAQVDLALRRTFYPNDRLSLDLRLEAFNALNHPSFADPVRYLANPLFGSPASMLNLMLGTGSPGSGMAPIFQTGGARSLQLSLKLRF